MTEIHKMSMILPISHELLYPDHRPGHIEPPMPEEVAAYQAWKKKFDPLYREGIDNGWFRDGGPDYDAEYEPPSGRWVYDD